jgi:predicted acylesterase/phospholipase RssA
MSHESDITIQNNNEIHNITEKSKQNETVTINKNNKHIKHIVLSGGAYLGLYEMGVLKYLFDKEFLNMDNIESVYGTSIGAFIAVLLLLDIEYDKIIEYFIERPWHKAIEITPNMIFDILTKKGLLDSSIFKISLEPLFKLKSYDIEITLQEFYNTTKKTLYMYSCQVNTMTVIEISHISHPDLKLIDALHMSCCIPYLFQPVWFQDSYMIDGGLVLVYSIKL